MRGRRCEAAKTRARLLSPAEVDREKPLGRSPGSEGSDLIQIAGGFTFPGDGRVVYRSRVPSLTVAGPRRSFTGLPCYALTGTQRQTLSYHALVRGSGSPGSLSSAPPITPRSSQNGSRVAMDVQANCSTSSDGTNADGVACGAPTRWAAATGRSRPPTAKAASSLPGSTRNRQSSTQTPVSTTPEQQRHRRRLR